MNVPGPTNPVVGFATKTPNLCSVARLISVMAPRLSGLLPPTPTTGVSPTAASQVIEAARKRAERLGVPVNVVVVDAGGNLVASARMERAWLGSLTIARTKATVARAFDMSTKELAELRRPDDLDADGRTTAIFPGGIPLMAGNTVVGAVGVSSGKPDLDHDVAAAAAFAFTTAG